MIRTLIIIILLLGFIAVVVVLDVPGVQKVLDLRSNITSEKERLLDKQELFAKVQELTRAYEDNKESVEKTEYVLPSSEKIPDLIVQVEALAFEQGLLLESIDITAIKEETGRTAEIPEEKTAANYKTLSISIKFIGSYESFKSFLKAVEENIRLMDISSVDFSSETEEADIFRFGITLTTYYYQ